MSERFIKFIPSEKSRWLMQHHPFAFLLLSLIAERVRRISGHIDGLQVGCCHIGDYESLGATRGQYREAVKTLMRLNLIEIIETCRTRKKANFDQAQTKSKNATTGTTTVGTLVKLLDSSIWDVNLEDNNHRNNHRTTTEQPPNNHEQERIKKEKRMKKEKLHSPIATSLLNDFFSSLRSFVPGFSDAKMKHTDAQLSAMDKMLKHYGEEKIRTAFRYAHGSTFWVSIIHSAVSLEKKIETLLLQEKNGQTYPKPNTSGNEPQTGEPKFRGQRVLKGDS